MRYATVLAVAVGLVGPLSAGTAAQSVEAVEQQITDIVDRLSASVVSIAVVSDGLGSQSRALPGGIRPLARSVGCGVVYDQSGHIITTARVVGLAEQVEVRDRGGTKYIGRVVGTDPQADVAVVKVDAQGLRPPAFAEKVSVRPGSWVFVIGNSFGSLPSVAMGVLSSVASEEDPAGEGVLLHLAVAVNPGDIGAAVVNSGGEVIGVVVGRMSFLPGGFSSGLPEGMGTALGGLFQPSSMGVAMPVDRALAIASDITARGPRERAFLGVRVVGLSGEMRQELGDPAVEGVVVTEVIASSPAESAGVARGDVITGLGSSKVNSVSSLSQMVSSARPGEVITVSLRRGRKAIEREVRLARYSAALALEPQVRRVSPDDLDNRIEQIKAEIDRLKSDLRRLEAERR